MARDANGKILGVCGTLAPGEGEPTLAGKLRLMWGLVPTGPRALLLTMRMLGAWEKHHPEEPYWYLGPVAVESELQGMGVGTRLMEAYCAFIDETGEPAYLEADKEINVRFYERFGFEVISEEEVLGTPNWFMLRRARGR